MFDYCTVAQAFEYGNSAGTATDPVNEAAVMARIVTAVSRAIDTYCGQTFAQVQYVALPLRGYVDRDNALVVHPPSPIIDTVVDGVYRYGRNGLYTPVVGEIDIIEAPTGAMIRWFGNYTSMRHRRIDVRLSYTGGYASLSALPPDLNWAAMALSWYTYQRRSAPMDVTAMPELGVVVRPGAWPDDIKRLLNNYKKVTPT